MNGKQAGFTYIALLIAVAILGAGLAAVGQVWQTVVQHDREKELIFVGNQFRQAINRYYASNRRYPLRLEDLVRDDRNAGVKRYLRKIFVDPMTGQPEWGMVKVANGQILGVYSLSEVEPLKKAGFRAADAGLENKSKYSEWLFMATVRGVAATPSTPAPVTPAPPKTAPTNRPQTFTLH